MSGTRGRGKVKSDCSHRHANSWHPHLRIPRWRVQLCQHSHPVMCRSGVFGECAVGEFNSFWVSNGRDSHTGSILTPGLYSTVVTLPRISCPETGSQTVAKALFLREANICARRACAGVLRRLTCNDAPEALQVHSNGYTEENTFQ